MAPLHHYGFGPAAVAGILAACGADDRDVARVDGAAGGAVGGTAGEGGTGGGAGVGGAVVPDPPGPGIACGEDTCAEGSEMCCVAGADRWCAERQCSSALARLECDDSADCPGERCCYTNIMQSNWIMTLCSSDCGMWLGAEVCKDASDCADDEPCRTFLCGALDPASRTVAISLCTATAPENCE